MQPRLIRRMLRVMDLLMNPVTVHLMEITQIHRQMETIQIAIIQMETTQIVTAMMILMMGSKNRFIIYSE